MQILAIPLSSVLEEDKWIWSTSVNGIPRPKKVYDYIRRNYFDPAPLPNEWRRLWKLNVTPKIRIFLCSGIAFLP